MGSSISHCETDPEAPTEDCSVAKAPEEAVEIPEAPEVEEPMETEEEPEETPVKLWTAPIDRRFPSTNQARNCYTRYNEFYKCVKENDADVESYEGPCTYYKKCYESLCPIEWVERWEEQRENGTWPGKY